MFSIKKMFQAFMILNMIALMLISVQVYMRKETEIKQNLGKNIEMLVTNISSSPKNPYAFEDPLTAYYILEQLDIFEPIDKYYAYPYQPRNFSKAYYGMKSDNDYCKRHRAYFADHPEFIFTQKNFIMDYSPRSLVRNKVVKVIGTDIQPYIGAHMRPSFRKDFKFDIRPDVNIFFTNDGMHARKRMGSQFSCLTQISNHIPGVTRLNRKDFAAESVVRYAKRYANKSECFTYSKFFPQTWVLRDPEQCREFFNRFNSEEYKQLKQERTIVYIRKIGAGSHQAKGVQPVNAREERIIRETYQNGTLCGKVRKSTIIQTYIHNPLLLDNHKFDFRIYMVIASTNPTILYYHDGFLRVSLHPYDVKSNDKSVLLTNTALSHKIFKIAKAEGNYQGLTESQLRDFQMWNFTRLQNYLIEKGLTSDPNWVDNYLRPELQKAMVHLVRMGQSPFLKRSQIYELFGVDFMIDKDLNLWFIECNSGPVLSGTSEQKSKFVTKMLRDQFEIVFGLLKSRTKRIIGFVNDIIKNKEVESSQEGDIVVKDLEKKREEFKEITKNYFEPEFEPSKKNGFYKIIDENLHGVDRFAGLIKEECLFESDF